MSGFQVRAAPGFVLEELRLLGSHKVEKLGGCLGCSGFPAETAGPLEGRPREERGKAEQCSCK